MRTLVLSTLCLFLLAGCDQPAPDSPPASTATPAPAESTPAPASAPTETATVKAPEGTCGDQSALPSDQRLANTPKWTLASEQDNFGFDVFRGDSEEGEFTKLNKEPILGAGTTDESSRYSWRDDSIDPCKDYWYYVESISTSGVREKMTPTFKAPAKRSPKAEPAAG
ncbi:MAG: hypothetical protein IPK54_12275 [Dokdonella sp.]|jgi:hypothetical protein|uniref:hypothetical protein n=1 Tax=Dokdonella sp. TaxID=2291710 RepID=UPI0025C17B73|nr:hypothetical protein [Dokdonella sp.]MBK8124307.1 hypothetical protein [Dokdonella sp.]MCC6440555.1 hypothetical protein [Rhodanobacteraceae bacterium]HPW02673.1 hypothetical protein [Dokdonella sp.]HQV48464.1 hypothetical protein [Dokdonella sp.]